MIIVSKSDLLKKLQLLDQDIIVISVARDEELESTKLIVSTFDDDFENLRSKFSCDEVKVTMKAKKKQKFTAQLYIESIYQLCDQMKDAIQKGRVEAAAPELVILDQFMVNIDDFLDKYCYDHRSE